jgi:hypothetical protein
MSSNLNCSCITMSRYIQMMHIFRKKKIHENLLLRNLNWNYLWLSINYLWLSINYLWLSINYVWLSIFYVCLSIIYLWLSINYLWLSINYLWLSINLLIFPRWIFFVKSKPGIFKPKRFINSSLTVVKCR